MSDSNSITATEVDIDKFVSLSLRQPGDPSALRLQLRPQTQTFPSTKHRSNQPEKPHAVPRVSLFIPTLLKMSLAGVSANNQIKYNAALNQRMKEDTTFHRLLCGETRQKQFSRAVRVFPLINLPLT
jgi:hypothetical protein